MASRPRRCTLGHGKRMADPAQRVVRREGDRLLGACAYPHHVSADSDLALQRDSKNPRTHVGLYAFLRVRRLRCRHRILHACAEIREPDRGECRFEYPARYLNTTFTTVGFPYFSASVKNT